MMIEAIIPLELRQRVVAVWGRDKFDLSKADFDARVQCYKRLTTVWQDPHVAVTHPDFIMGGRWDQTNTVLVDDSVEKGRSEPFNLIEIPEYFGNENEVGEILPQVHDYLNHLSMHSNVSACLRMVPFKAMAAPIGPPSSYGQPPVGGSVQTHSPLPMNGPTSSYEPPPINGPPSQPWGAKGPQQVSQPWTPQGRY
jgi:hypothetical protein